MFNIMSLLTLYGKRETQFEYTNIYLSTRVVRKVLFAWFARRLIHKMAEVAEVF